MKRNGLHQPLLPLLAGSLLSLLAGLASAAPAPGERPRPENYANYGLYVAALVDYERAQEAAARDSGNNGDKRRDKSKICADTQDGKSRQQNSCQGKYLAGQDLIEEKAEQPDEALSDTVVRGRQDAPESLEAAVASAGYDPVSAANADALRQNTTGMTLQEITPDEMASAGVEGLLGMFNNIRMQNLNASAAPQGTWGIAGGSSATSDETIVRLSLDDLMVTLDNLNLEIFGSLVNFGNGYGIVDAEVSINASGGLHLDLSSEIYTGMQIVDRDGLPGTLWAGAGAVTLDRMEIFVPYLSVDIQGVSADFERGDDLLTIAAYSPGEIYANLANTSIGVAPATADGSWIGPTTNFLEFGPTSRLTIAAGTRVNVLLGKPDGLRKPLVTLNGRIGDISVNDIRLLDNLSGGGIGLGRLAITGLELVDARVFLEDKRVTVDVGRGLTNVGMDIERVWLGAPVEGQFIGDFYMRGARVNELRMSATPH